MGILPLAVNFSGIQTYVMLPTSFGFWIVEFQDQVWKVMTDFNKE